MNKVIRLARPLPGNILSHQLPRKLGDSCEQIRDQTDSAGHHIIFVRFPDGERRVLVDKDVAAEITNASITIAAVHDDHVATWEDWDDLGGEA